MKASHFSFLALLAGTATARYGQSSSPGRGMWHLPAGNPISLSNVKNSTFEQLIDHSNPSLGTFDQFYMYDTTYCDGPGCPVVLFTPGEVNASLYTNYLVTNRTTGVLAKQIGAATIVLEHRYWGTSLPGDELTIENLQYLTLDNAIADLIYFANNVKLPFDKNGASNAANTPWTLVGGSYSGALTAWTASVAPGTLWAYLASSAVVETIENFWEYFLPVQLGMPQNCSKDVNLVIDHMDHVLTTGSKKEIYDLKCMFGLEGIEHNDDFMNALENGPWLWQGNQFYETAGFYTWCDYIENSVNETDPAKLPGAEGVGLEKALKGYARWSKYFFPDWCQETYGYFGGGMNTECFNTHNKSNQIFTDISLANTGDRQWNWMLCNEPFGWWQTGAPKGHSTLVSRLVDVEYFQRQCNLYFPGVDFTQNVGRVNKYTGGWEIDNTTRLVYTNGGFDPWRYSTVSSDFRPSGPLESTAQVPVNIVPGGFHTSDLVTENGQVNEGCRKVIDAEVAQLVAWNKEWPSGKARKHHGGA